MRFVLLICVMIAGRSFPSSPQEDFGSFYFSVDVEV
jgi:hypothetical protein